MPAPESPTPLDALDYVLRVRKACLLPLPQLTLSDDITLLVRTRYTNCSSTLHFTCVCPVTQTLKTQLLSSRALCTARTYALNVSSLSMDRPVTDVEPSEGRCLSDFGITPKHIRVREKGLNNVPGRSVVCVTCVRMLPSSCAGVWACLLVEAVF